MTTAYYYEDGRINFVFNSQGSKLGYAYPRLFVQFLDDGSCMNVDLRLKYIFELTAEEFANWAAKAVKLTDVEQVRNAAADVGFNWDMMEAFVFGLLEKYG